MTILNSIEKEILVDSFRVHFTDNFTDLVRKFEEGMEEALIKTIEDNKVLLMAHRIDISDMENSDDGIKQLFAELKPDFVKASKEIISMAYGNVVGGDEENA